MMQDQIENSMIKDHFWKPCRTEAPSFKEYVLETLSLKELVDDPLIFDVLMNEYYEDYQEWLKEIS